MSQPWKFLSRLQIHGHTLGKTLPVSYSSDLDLRIMVGEETPWPHEVPFRVDHCSKAAQQQSEEHYSPDKLERRIRRPRRSEDPAQDEVFVRWFDMGAI